MPSLFDIRRDNMRLLIKEWGGVTSLAAKLGYSNASYIVQMAGPNPTRHITEKAARKYEEALGLAQGFLDTPPKRKASPDVDANLVTDTVRLAGAISEEMNVRLPAGKFADVVAMIYQDAAGKGALDEAYARKVINLAK